MEVDTGTEDDLRAPPPAEGPRASRRAARLLVISGLCVVGAGLTTWSSFDAWFVGDDLGEIQRADDGDTRAAHVRPLVTLMLRGSRALGGLDPRAYHAVGIALHAVVIGLVAWVASAIAREHGVAHRRRRWVAPLAATVFALLATHSEATSWISAHGDLVVAACGLVAVGAWLHRDDDRRWRWVAVGALVVALMSKEHAVAIPALCIVVGVAQGPDRWRRVGRAITDARPLLAVLAVYIAARALVLGSLVASYEDGDAFNWNPVVMVGRVGAMTIRSVVPGLGAVGWIAVAIATAALAVAAWAGRSAVPRNGTAADRRAAGLCLALTVVSLLPAAGLGVSLTDVRGDRLVYLASTFAAISLAFVAIAAIDAMGSAGLRTAAVGVMIALLIASGLAALERDRRWADAGDVAEQTLGPGSMWVTSRQVVVINPADNLRGAYLHRNALGDAAVVAHGWPAPSLVAHIAPMRLSSPSAQVDVRRVGRRRWLVTPDPGKAEFLPPPGDERRWQVAGLTADLRPDGSLDVRVSDEVDLADVWYLSEGRFRSLDPTG